MRNLKITPYGKGLLITLLALVCIYAPLLSGDYLIRDDFLLFKDNIFFDTTLPCGRFLDGWLYTLFHKMLVSLHPSLYAKLFTLAGVALLQTALCRWLRTIRFGAVEAWLVSLLVVTLPAFILYIAWIVCSLYPYALLLILFAFGLLNSLYRRVAGGRPIGWPMVARNGLLAILFYVMSLMIYQPAAMFYYALIASFLIFCASSTLWRRLAAAVTMVALGLVGNGLYYLIYIKVLSLYGRTLTGRTALTRDLAGKCTFFKNEVLYRALNGWNIFPNRTVAGVAVMVILSGAILELVRIPRRTRRPVIKGLGVWITKYTALATLLVLSYLPVLVTAHCSPVYRTLLAPTTILLFLFLDGSRRLLALWPGRARGRSRAFRLVLLLASALGVMALTHQHARKYIYLPHAREFRFITNALQAGATRPLSKVIFIWCESGEGLVERRLIRNDEFGSPSSSVRWTGQWMVRAACKELGLDDSRLSVEVVNNSQFRQKQKAYRMTPGLLVIDAGELKRYR